MQSRLLYDVQDHYSQYKWAINPVGQLVEIDTRVDFQREGINVRARFCSGFNINQEGMFLTAGHCLTRGDSCYQLTQGIIASYRISFNYHVGSMQEHFYPINAYLDSGPCVSTWGHRESSDFAVLQLDKSAGDFGYLSPLLNMPTMNSSVVVVAHPNGNPKKISFGNIRGLTDSKGDKFIDHTARIEPGSSGSSLSAVIPTRTTGTIAVALGINIRQSVDEKRQPDHKSYVTIPMETVANQSAVVRRVSFFVDRDGSLKSGAQGINLQPETPRKKCC